MNVMIARDPRGDALFKIASSQCCIAAISSGGRKHAAQCHI